MENRDYIEIDGVYYYKLYCCDPMSELPLNCDYGHFWKHHDCGGDIYISDDAHLLCKRCGQIWPIVYSKTMTPLTANVKDYYWHQSETPDYLTANNIVFGNRMIHAMGINCLRRLLASLEKQLPEYGKDKPI